MKTLIGVLIMVALIAGMFGCSSIPYSEENIGDYDMGADMFDADAATLE